MRVPIGVNTFLPKDHAGETVTIELICSTVKKKAQQIANIEAFRVNRNALTSDSPKGLRQNQAFAKL